MTTLANDFEDDFADALLEDGADVLADARDDLVDEAEANWKAYAAANGYDIDHIWQDVTTEAVQRRGRTLSTRVEWPALSALFEYGVDPHTITGNPTLAFAWDSPPQGTRPPGAPSYVVADEVNWGSVTGGIDRSRAIRNALDAVRMDLRGD